jgi:hypothetical protein
LTTLPLPKNSARGVHTIGEKWKSGELPDDSDTLTGTLIVEAIVLTPDEFFGLESLQKIEPSERFGNLLIFRGSFNLPIAHANRFYWRAWIVCTIPNVVLRRRSFCSNARPDLNPNFYPAWIELGNLHAQRAERDDAVHAFENALQHAPQVPTFRKILADQISILRTAPDITTIHPIRDPFTE